MTNGKVSDFDQVSVEATQLHVYISTEICLYAHMYEYVLGNGRSLEVKGSNSISCILPYEY